MSSTRLSVRTKVIAAAVLLGATSLVVMYGLRRPGPDEAAREFWSNFQAQRWGALYDMASDVEKSLQPFSREQYIGLMTDLASHCLGEVGPAEMVGDYQSQTTSKHFEFKYTYSMAPSPDVKGIVSFHCFSGPKRWHPSVYNMPLHIITPSGPGNRESRKLFYELCVKNGVTGFVRPTDKLVTSVARIGEYLEGKREYRTVESYAALVR